MNSNRLPEDESSDSPDSPLLSIGFVVASVLIVPIILYSVGPEGPLKVGDVVFSTDRHRVMFVDSSLPHVQGYQDFCILESRVQLVVQKIETSAHSQIIAEPIGVDTIEVPYCPPRTSVVLKSYQATLKADLWGGLRDTLSHLVSGR